MDIFCQIVGKSVKAFLRWMDEPSETWKHKALGHDYHRRRDIRMISYSFMGDYVLEVLHATQHHVIDFDERRP